MNPSPEREKAFTPKQRLILAAAPPLATGLFKGLCATCRMDVRGEEHLHSVIAEHGRAIIPFWHESFGLAAWHFNNTGYWTLISKSYDGELAARVVQRFGFQIARGSSSRGGYEALGELRKALRQPPGLGFTLDGPRGPRRIAKPGIIILSSVSRVPITPMALVATSAWRLHSWDRFVIPKPFARIRVAYGEAIPPPAERSPEALEATRLQVEQSLNALHAELGDAL